MKKETNLIGMMKEVGEKKGRKESLLLQVFVKVKQEDLLESLNRRMYELLVTLLNQDKERRENMVVVKRLVMNAL